MFIAVISSPSTSLRIIGAFSSPLSATLSLDLMTFSDVGLWAGARVSVLSIPKGVMVHPDPDDRITDDFDIVAAGVVAKDGTLTMSMDV